MIAALAVALQLALSGTSPANLAIPAMAGIHAIIGIGEGLITWARWRLFTPPAAIWCRPVEAEAQKAVSWCGLSGWQSPSCWQSSHRWHRLNPDGLEWVAEQKGFLDTAQGPLYQIYPRLCFSGRF